MSLKRQAATGFFWVAIERFGQLFLQAILFVILSRLLSPDDFGLIAMLMIFFAISQSFIDSGMGQALIRQTHISDKDRSTVFWFNMLLSMLFYLFLYVSAPYIAKFFKQPQLIALTRVLGLSIIFFGITVVQRAELTHKLNFKTQAYATIPAFAIAGLASVILAYTGFGVWSLVAQYLLLAVFSSLFLWLMRPIKILMRWDRDSFTRLFGFGYKLLLSGLINTVYIHIYKLVIGRLFSSGVLGFYTQAQKMRDMVTQGLMSVIDKVSYPLLSKSKDNIEQLKQNYRKMIKVSSFVVFPSILSMMLLAEPIVVHTLGVKWQPSAIYLQLICTHGILYHLHAINLNALKVLGRSDLFLRLEIIKKINITIAILISMPFGIFGLLIGQIISSYFALFINSFYTVKFLRYSYFQQGRDIVEILLLSLPLVIFIYCFQNLFEINSLLVLILCLVSGGGVYVVTGFAVKSATFTLIFDTLQAYLPKSLKRKHHLYDTRN